MHGNETIKEVQINIPPDEQEIIKAAWYKFDIDNSGTIDMEEFKAVLEDLEIIATHEELEDIF